MVSQDSGCLPSPKQQGTNFRERSSIQQCVWVSLVSLKCTAKAFAGNSQQLSSASWALQALQDHYSEIMQVNPQEGSRSAHLPEPSCFLFSSETPYASARVWTMVYVDPTVLPSTALPPCVLGVYLSQKEQLEEWVHETSAIPGQPDNWWVPP